MLGMSPFQAAVGGGQGKGPCRYRYEDKGMRHGQGALHHPAIVEGSEDRRDKVALCCPLNRICNVVCICVCVCACACAGV